ncbi:MAG: acyl-CoA dehydrogenase family protein [Labilithrix sp.]|nr:acyl-CoA dehydrogenase family protein [Labilithrix sp.]
MNILTYLLGAPIARGPYSSIASWMTRLPQCPFSGEVERAIWGGYHTDRLGYAFAAGYAAALRRLLDHAASTQGLARPFPDPPLSGHACLCATESGGAHPRAIQTKLDKQGGALVVSGEKTYATLATLADELLVVASRGSEQGGKNRLRVVRVSPGAEGVTITEREPPPFAPEIPHAIVKLDGVVVESSHVLPGDGYDVYLKPFRTIEDVHVLAATVGFSMGAARAHGFGRDVETELVSLALSLVDVGARDPSSPLTHVILAGLFGSARRLLASLDGAWTARAPEEERLRWERDRALLLVAEQARGRRLEAAYASISSS